MFNKLLVTANKKKNESMIIMPGVSDAIYSTIQEVVKVGPQVAQIQVGDLVEIIVNNFAVRKTNSIKEDLVKEYHEVSLPIEEFDGEEYMVISDRDVKYFWICRDC